MMPARAGHWTEKKEFTCSLVQKLLKNCAFTCSLVHTFLKNCVFTCSLVHKLLKNRSSLVHLWTDFRKTRVHCSLVHKLLKNCVFTCSLVHILLKNCVFTCSFVRTLRTWELFANFWTVHAQPFHHESKKFFFLTFSSFFAKIKCQLVQLDIRSDQGIFLVPVILVLGSIRQK